MCHFSDSLLGVKGKRARSRGEVAGWVTLDIVAMSTLIVNNTSVFYWCYYWSIFLSCPIVASSAAFPVFPFNLTLAATIGFAYFSHFSPSHSRSQDTALLSTYNH